MMFGDRCYNEPQCGHSVNWTCPCTCGEGSRYEAPQLPVPTPPPSEETRLKAQIEGMACYVQHDAGCEANDLDYLDKAPCTCGLRRFYNPKGHADPEQSPPAAKVDREACKECGGSSLLWFVHYHNRSQVVEGRLRTGDVECLFVLGCEECSATQRTVAADKVAAMLALQRAAQGVAAGPGA